MNKKKHSLISPILHIFVLSNFAIAQPLYDILSRNAEFLVAHQLKPFNFIFLVLTLSLIIPLLLGILVIFSGIFGKFIRSWVHSLIVALLVSLILMPVVKKMGGISGELLITGTAIAGLVAAISYVRFRGVRLFLTYLSPVILLFPSLFIFNTQVSKLVFSRFKFENSSKNINKKNLPSIVFVIFDEFCLVDLMDKDHNIDSVRYPNFAALAKDSYWFRNATTVADGTVQAVPAILTGMYPQKGLLPIYPDHPKNLFIMLCSDYFLNVFEAVTQLCPAELCQDRDHVENGFSHIALFSIDLFMVYSHMMFPSDYEKKLPSVSQNWGGFIQGSFVPSFRKKFEAKQVGMKDSYDQFVVSLRKTSQPSLYFIHLSTPHSPWIFLPSGARHNGGGLNFFDREQWVENINLVSCKYQQYLMQVGYVDKLLGQLMNKLKKINRYDSSLIVITADHGVSFRPGDKRRPLTETNYREILPVPLFIKKPFQEQGVVSDKNVQTIDILPTLADILDLELPWKVDGSSALDDSLLEIKEKICYGRRDFKKMVFRADFEDKYEGLNQKLALFNSGEKPDGVFRMGPHHEFLGRSLKDMNVINGVGMSYELDQKMLYESVDLKSGFLPAFIKGQIDVKNRFNGSLDLIFAVNGMIQASTKTYEEEGVLRFAAMLSEDAFRQGKNEIEVFAVKDEKGQIQLIRCFEKNLEYTHALLSGDSEIKTTEGNSIPIIPKAMESYLDSAGLDNGIYYFSGWAVDPGEFEPAKSILIFKDGKIVFFEHPNAARPDVAEHFRKDSIRNVGFSIKIPQELVGDVKGSCIRVFALSQGGDASELNYPTDYPFGGKS